MTIFHDRKDAGQQLAKQLKKYINARDTIILALPRGGVPIGFEISAALKLPLDIYLVRKLGVPGYEELALGAIASGGIVVYNNNILSELKIRKEDITKIIASEKTVLTQREQRYRQNRAPLKLQNQTVILVDDGVATGATLRAAIAAIRKRHCAKIIVAVPVAPSETLHELAKETDEIVCLAQPEPFIAISCGYVNFPQTSDEEVCTLLKEASSKNLL